MIEAYMIVTSRGSYAWEGLLSDEDVLNAARRYNGRGEKVTAIFKYGKSWLKDGPLQDALMPIIAGPDAAGTR